MTLDTMSLRRRGLFGLRPIQAFVAAFAAAILCGTILLRLPAAAHGVPLTLLEALFTATSAVCVTGLVVVDTGTRLTPFGQGVVIALIQAGGLGIMTASTFLLFLLGRRASFAENEMVSASYGRSDPLTARALVLITVGITLVAESLGAIALYWGFRDTLPEVLGHTLTGGQTAWYAIFHSVSAFCNAGFSIVPGGQSLEPWVEHAGINAAVMGLIVVGGIGIPVLVDLGRLVMKKVHRRPAHLGLHTRLVLWTTGSLVVGGALCILLFGQWGPLTDLRWPTRMEAALFQSVTARTAGFNTVPIGALGEPVLLLIVMLMIVGGSPGSTAGGLKTTALATMVLTIRARLRSRHEVSAFGRTVPHGTTSKVFALLTAYLAVLFLATLVMLTFERHIPLPEGKGLVTCIGFEVVSAFATVGLSTGITADLGPVGRIVLVIIMFAGRLGPLTFIESISRGARPLKYKYPEEDIIVG